MNAKRLALRVLLVSTAVACVLGIASIFIHHPGNFALKALFTSIVLAGCSLLVVGCLVAWDMTSARVPSRIGVLAAISSAVLVLAGVWFEPQSDTFWNITGSAAVLAIAGAHASVMWMARLGPRAQWLRTFALATSVMIVMLVFALIWGNIHGDKLAQLLAVLSIAEGGLTIAIAAISTANRAAPAGEGVAEVYFCPRCGKHLWLPAGEVRCRHCDEMFFIELRQVTELPSAVVKS